MDSIKFVEIVVSIKEEPVDVDEEAALSDKEDKENGEVFIKQEQNCSENGSDDEVKSELGTSLVKSEPFKSDSDSDAYDELPIQRDITEGKSGDNSVKQCLPKKEKNLKKVEKKNNGGIATDKQRQSDTKKPLQKKSFKAKQNDDSDGEYDPRYETKNKEKNTEKRKTIGRPRGEDSSYTDDILKHISVITLNESERVKEHEEALEARRHMEFLCQNCAAGFVTEDSYLTHMKIHDSEYSDYGCNICGAHLKTRRLLYSHKTRHYQRYVCTLCHARHKDKHAAACHVMQAHAGQAFVCTQCGRGFKRPQYLKHHTEQHHTRSKTFVCEECHRIFYDRAWFMCHKRRHKLDVLAKTQPPEPCPVCSRLYKNRTSLKKHLKTHEENIPCTICYMVFQNKSSLRKHYLQAHNQNYVNNPQEETCPHCLRVCVSAAMLKRHMERMHSDRTKKYECDHCHRLYLTKGDVRSHIAWSHAGVARRHACAAPACGRVFRTPCLLRDHTRRHHAAAAPPPARDHRCDHCGKAFMNRQVLKRHMQVHSEETYPCKECGLTFKTKTYVEVHYKIKHLNMTREEIKAQKKSKMKDTTNYISTSMNDNETDAIPTSNHERKMVELYIPNIQSNGNIHFNNVEPNENCDNQLLMQETDVNITGINNDIQTPQFGMFINI